MGRLTKAASVVGIVLENKNATFKEKIFSNDMVMVIGIMYQYAKMLGVV